MQKEKHVASYQACWLFSPEKATHIDYISLLSLLFVLIYLMHRSRVVTQTFLHRSSKDYLRAFIGHSFPWQQLGKLKTSRSVAC